MNSKSQRVRFAVSGEGGFPIDMLRFDECWPASQVDSTRIAEESVMRRTVRLRSDKTPNEQRWKSYGWSIVEVA